MRRQVLVVGLGRFGISVASTLFKRGHDVLAIDQDERRVQDMLPHVTYCLVADATNETALQDIGLDRFDLAVVATGEQVHSSILATVLLKRLGVHHVVARAENELHGLTLERIGADQVVYPERESGERLAYNLSYSGVRDYLRLEEGYGVSKIYPPREFLGRTIDEVDLGPRSASGLTVLGLVRGKDIILTPDRFERIRDGDVLVIAGLDAGLQGLDDVDERES